MAVSFRAGRGRRARLRCGRQRPLVLNAPLVRHPLRRPRQPSRWQALGGALLAALDELVAIERYFNWGLLDLLLWLSWGEPCFGPPKRPKK